MKLFIAVAMLCCGSLMAQDFAVLFYQQGNAQGIPTNWPARVQSWDASYPSPWVRMTPSQLNSQLQSAAAAYAAWEASAAAAAAEAQIAETRAAAKAMMDKMDEQGRQLRAFAEVVVDEINLLRSQHSLSARTLTQLRNAINAKIDAR